MPLACPLKLKAHLFSERLLVQLSGLGHGADGCRYVGERQKKIKK